jgi:hypothetical protein
VYDKVYDKACKHVLHRKLTYPGKYSVKYVGGKPEKTEKVLNQVLDGGRGRTKRFWIRFSVRGPSVRGLFIYASDLPALFCRSRLADS